MNNLDLFKRKGYFKLDAYLLRNSIDLSELFRSVIIVRAEHKFIYDYFEYEAFSNDFDVTPEFSLAPEYQAEFNNGVFKGWVKVE